jgi:hypothetical protein
MVPALLRYAPPSNPIDMVLLEEIDALLLFTDVAGGLAETVRVGHVVTADEDQMRGRLGRFSRTASTAHRSGAIPAICVSASSVLPRSSVTEASSQIPERRSSSKPAAM